MDYSWLENNSYGLWTILQVTWTFRSRNIWRNATNNKLINFFLQILNHFLQIKLIKSNYYISIFNFCNFILRIKKLKLGIFCEFKSKFLDKFLFCRFTFIKKYILWNENKKLIYKKWI